MFITKIRYGISIFFYQIMLKLSYLVNVMKIIKKYEIFLKYITVSIISFIIDIAFFNIFLLVFKNIDNKIIISTIIARIISSLINYLLNKNKVFNSKEKVFNTIIKYYALVIIQMLISAFMVNFIYSKVSINPTIIKIPVEFIIFICNYLIQKVFIFKKVKNENK